VFENSVLWRICGPKRKELAGDWRRLHDEEFRNFYASRNVITVITLRWMKWARYVARMGKMRNAYKFLFGKPEGKRLLGRRRRRWEDNIRMDLREIE
jgi:hypothetical protein